MRTISVAAIGRHEENRAVSTLTLAFADDPAVRWMYPDDGEYQEHFPVFARAFGGRAFAVGTALEVDHFRGVSLWLPPGVHPDDDAVIDLITRSVPERDREPLFAMFEQMGDYHPAEPHWHLPLVGVVPRSQGRGYGSALLHRTLARCDAEGTLAYLESSNVRNIPLYRRLGFEVLGTIQVGTSPPVTPMLRRPH